MRLTKSHQSTPTQTHSMSHAWDTRSLALAGVAAGFAQPFVAFASRALPATFRTSQFLCGCHSSRASSKGLRLTKSQSKRGSAGEVDTRRRECKMMQSAGVNTQEMKWWSSCCVSFSDLHEAIDDALKVCKADIAAADEKVDLEP